MRAKALYALEIQAIYPHIQEEYGCHLINAYHPLLLADYGREKTIPLTLEINEEYQIIVISGPNAGGKSISLKTVGLLSLMLSKGLLVPVHPHSKMHLYREIYTDIGDEQSIVNQLSTYSSHLDFI